MINSEEARSGYGISSTFPKDHAISGRSTLSSPPGMLIRLKPFAKAQPLNMPHILRPFSSRESKTRHVEYQLVGRTFLGHSHFVSRYSVASSAKSGQPSCYFFGGMANNGLRTREEKTAPTLLRGHGMDLPAGYCDYRPSIAIYSPRGGQKAQEWAWDKQTNGLKKHLHVDLNIPSNRSIKNIPPTMTREDVRKVPMKDLEWLSTTARR
ncbi:hypothetical protein PM082_018129 [Marasmius tenuissimus]|nr:hypothetical protein PM082_018129 [Marasmius tenuissimus]